VSPKASHNRYYRTMGMKDDQTPPCFGDLYQYDSSDVRCMAHCSHQVMCGACVDRVLTILQARLDGRDTLAERKRLDLQFPSLAPEPLD